MEEVLSIFEDIIGKEYVHTGEQQLGRYYWANIPLEKRNVVAALKPANKEEIIEIVKVASEYKIALYPISTGNNWGYGSANPVRENNVILDLSRMNKIIEINTKLAYAVIEPGVTQEQLSDHLEKIGKDNGDYRLMMDPTGSGPSCSVLGNTLERGYGITPYGDHFNAMCGMEIILPDGSCLKTGFGHFEHSKVTRLFKYGTGPYLDGIFTQSNFGIVVSIGIWLMPEPEYYEVCYFASNAENAMGELIDSIRWLLLNQVVKGSINLMHRDRILTLMTQYPWNEMEGETPLREDVSRKIAKDLDVFDWNGVVALYGTKEEVKASRKVIKRILKGKVERINFVSEFLLNTVKRYQLLLQPISLILGINIKELIKVLDPSLKLMKGKPCEISLPTPYWRSKKPIPAANINPAKDNCGIIWLAPVVPLIKEAAEDFIKLMSEIFYKNGFELCITFTAVTSRAFDCTLPILYNKEDEEETQKAKECYEEALQACLDNGYIPYRFGIQSMDKIVDKGDIFWKVAHKIKKSIDPIGIISPGKYSF